MTQETIYGSDLALPGVAYPPVSIAEGSSGLTGLTITQGASGVTGSYWTVYHFDGTPICEQVAAGHLQAYGVQLGASLVTTTGWTSPVLDGTQNPPCLTGNDGNSMGMHTWAGTGAPVNGTTVGSSPSNGDEYFRLDTPTTANQRVYKYISGTWTGIV